DLCPRELRLNVSVGLHQLLKITILIPNTHCVALHPLVRRLARQSFISQRQQQLTTENQTFHQLQVLEHPLGIDHKTVNQSDRLLQDIVERDARIRQH